MIEIINWYINLYFGINPFCLLNFKISSVKPRIKNKDVAISMNLINVFDRSAQSKVPKNIERTIMIPPIVGVPSFLNCCLGPSSLIFSVRENFFKRLTRLLPKMKIKRRDVIDDIAALNVIYLKRATSLKIEDKIDEIILKIPLNF